MSKPKISICIPTHDMELTDFFVDRLLLSLDKQTFRDFEVKMTKEGKMAENSNAAIKCATGEIVKVLYMDDYLYDEYALQHIADAFDKGAKWAVSGCVHDNGSIHNPHYPKWSEDVRAGLNTIGSPSVLSFLNDDPLLFDERMSWLLDCELYGRLFDRYGEPTLINYLDVAIGIHKDQMTNILSDKEKEQEYNYL